MLAMSFSKVDEVTVNTAVLARAASECRKLVEFHKRVKSKSGNDEYRELCATSALLALDALLKEMPDKERCCFAFLEPPWRQGLPVEPE